MDDKGLHETIWQLKREIGMKCTQMNAKVNRSSDSCKRLKREVDAINRDKSVEEIINFYRQECEKAKSMSKRALEKVKKLERALLPKT